MQCPIDGSELVMTERGGVEIDYCPKCRGVWLDRGELDKIIERGAAQAPAPQAAAARRVRAAARGPRARGLRAGRQALQEEARGLPGRALRFLSGRDYR